MVFQHLYSFSSDEESSDCRKCFLAEDYNDSHLLRHLIERVELEQQRESSHKDNNAQLKQIPRPIPPEVEIEGMDIIIHALANKEEDSTESGYSSTGSSDNTTIYDSSDDDDSVLQMRGGKFRCQSRNGKDVYRHWDLKNDLNVDSLRLSRKRMERQRKNRDKNSHDNVDCLSFDSVDLCNDVNDTVDIMMKGPTRSSMPSTTSATSIVFATPRSSTPKIYRNAAA
jgi:hypothetical protein